VSRRCAFTCTESGGPDTCVRAKGVRWSGCRLHLGASRTGGILLNVRGQAVAGRTHLRQLPLRYQTGDRSAQLVAAERWLAAANTGEEQLRPQRDTLSLRAREVVVLTAYHGPDDVLYEAGVVVPQELPDEAVELLLRPAAAPRRRRRRPQVLRAEGL